MTILVPMIVGLSLLASVIPNEVVPRAVVVGNDATYVLQSLQTAILVPAGVVLLVLLLPLQAFVFKTRPVPQPQPPTAKSGVWGILCRSGRRVQYFIAFCCFLMLGVLFLYVVLLQPLSQFRRVDVSDTSIVCGSLYRTREIPLVDITEVRVAQRNARRKRIDYREYWIAIECRSGTLRSIEIRRPVSAEDLPLFVDTMNACVADINNRRQRAR